MEDTALQEDNMDKTSRKSNKQYSDKKLHAACWQVKKNKIIYIKTNENCLKFSGNTF